MPPIDPPTTPAHLVDPEMVGQQDLGGHLVADRQSREPGAPGHTVGCGRRQYRGALAAAEDVGAHHEPSVGVDGRAGTHQRVPPPRGRVSGTGRSGGVRVAGQGVQEEHGVRARRIKRPPRLIGDGDPGQGGAPLQSQSAILLGQRGEVAAVRLVTGVP